MPTVDITYFTDVLCIWAYIGQARLDLVKEKFADSIRIEQRFCSVFGDTAGKMASVWKQRGLYDGFNKHLLQVAERFPHVEISPDIWIKARPASSASPHLFLKALQLSEAPSAAEAIRVAPGTFERTMWAFRLAFFRDARDISQWDVQCALAKPLGVDLAAIERLIDSGVAFAGLAADYQDADKMRIEGSPSLVLNEGRQKLYGNVGFRVIEANIQELLREPRASDASWC